jgi:predicted DNA-binding ribbon-helix-helix protein
VQSTVIKRSVMIDRHKTSVSLEEAFWKALREMARKRGVTISALVSAASRDRQIGNLSSHLRLMVLNDLKNRTPSADGERSSAHSGDENVHLSGGETNTTPLGVRH